MIRHKFLLTILFLALIVHCVMLINLSRHFSFSFNDPPGWSPLSYGNQPPKHWQKDQPAKGILTDSGSHYFENKMLFFKEKQIRTNPLIFVPVRKTDNFGLELLVRDANRTDPGGDFFQLYHAGYSARHGMGIYKNDPDGTNPEIAKFLKKTVPFHPPNRYPPGFIFTIGIILSLFSPWNAYMFWILMHEIVLGYCIYLSRSLSRNNPAVSLMAAAMWLAFLPWYLELYMGQTTFLIMAGTFVLGAHLHKKANVFSAWSWWTLTLLTKPLTLLFTPLLLRMKRFYFVFTGLGIWAFSTFLYFFFYPEDAGIFFGWAFGQSMVASLGNLCFQNLAYHFFFSKVFVVIISFVVISIGMYFTFIHRPFDPVRILCLWVCVYFLGYTHVWEHHQVLLQCATILPLIVSNKRRFILPWLFAAIPTPFYIFEGHWNWAREVLYLISGTIAPMLLFLLLICCRLDKR